jgi:hypothetical protein
VKSNVVHWLRLQWDRASAWACVVAGVVCLIIGWFGVSGESLPGKQLPYIASNGLGGIFLLGTGAMLWLSADLRDEWRKLDSIEEAIRENGTAGIVLAPPVIAAEGRLRTADEQLRSVRLTAAVHRRAGSTGEVAVDASRSAGR